MLAHNRSTCHGPAISRLQKRQSSLQAWSRQYLSCFCCKERRLRPASQACQTSVMSSASTLAIGVQSLDDRLDYGALRLVILTGLVGDGRVPDRLAPFAMACSLSASTASRAA